MIDDLISDPLDIMPMAGALNVLVGNGLYTSAATAIPRRPDALEPREHIIHCTDPQVAILDATVASVTNRAEIWGNRGEL